MGENGYLRGPRETPSGSPEERVTHPQSPAGGVSLPRSRRSRRVDSHRASADRERAGLRLRGAPPLSLCLCPSVPHEDADIVFGATCFRRTHLRPFAESRRQRASFWRRSHAGSEWTHFPAVKRNEILPFGTTWMDPEGTTPTETSRRKTKCHAVSFTRGI